MSGYVVRDLPNLVISSSGSLFSSGIGHLDDAESITIYLSTAAAALLLVPTIQIAQFDPSWTSQLGVTQSTQWYATTDIEPFTAGGARTIANISFRGLRIATSAGSSVVGGTTVAFATKQIVV